MAPAQSPRYYQIVLIWLKDQEKFQRYLELLPPIVSRYGGALERALTPESIHPESLSKPSVVNIVYYSDQEAFQQLALDPDFRAIVQLRSESIDMMAINGVAIEGEVVNETVRERLYFVEVARFGPGGATAYAEYERESSPVLAEYGYRVERVISPDSASGLAFQPDVARVAYFAPASGMARFHQDPRHERIERELYPAVTSDSLWIVGRALSAP
ncbi:MAG: DUF1330 domain-containing protein [Myxococcota bacterium]